MLPPPLPRLKTHIPSLFQLIISIVSLGGAMITVLGIWAMTKINSTATDPSKAITQQMSVILWIVLVISLISLPSLILSIRRLSGKRLVNNQPRHQFLIGSVITLLFIPAAYLGYTKNDLMNIPLVMAVLNVIAVVVPLWWFFQLGRVRLTASSPQRQWGLVNFSVFAGLPLILFVELLILILGLIVGGVWLFQQPEFKPIYMTLQTQLMLDPLEMTTSLEKMGLLLQKPGVLAAGFFLVVILLPLAEEILKPLAIWFFIKRDWRPSEGFSAGLVCGASFALVESVFSLASLSQETWWATMVGRIGTGLLHTLTTGITGWALVSAWRDGRYKRIGFAYLASVSIHGTWNLFAMLYGVGSNLTMFTESSLAGIITASPWILGGLFAGMLALLLVMNRKIRSSLVPPAIPALPVETIG
jgi:hypothetical protein